MSQFDHGKHPKDDESGKIIPNTKRLDGQRTPKKLEARQAAHAESLRSADAKVRGGFHKPGSQNRNK